jgi:DNA-binding response OmpR family regulator
MLVDLMLGGMDGFSFIQRARPQSEAPIVVISARDGVQDVVSALEAGADDYVTKPFVVDEVRPGSGLCCAGPP